VAELNQKKWNLVYLVIIFEINTGEILWMDLDL
jgi:hypothetical protein